MTFRPGDAIPVACELSVFTAEQSAGHDAALRRMRAEALGRDELPDGYAWRYAQDPSLLAALAEFVGYERMCCPFFTFTIVMEPPGGALWLRLTGPEGTKAILSENAAIGA
ncbi:MAG: hypothetical protein ACR2HN_07765 [Tepidiformaceae bacterium]